LFTFKLCFLALLLEQMDSHTLASLPEPLVHALSAPITVVHAWSSDSDSLTKSTRAQSYQLAAAKLQSCNQASSCELVVRVEAQAVEQPGSLHSLHVFKEVGVHSLQLIWNPEAGQHLNGQHLQILGAATGHYITDLKLVCVGTIPDVVWSDLWAAFPRLQSLSVYAYSLGSTAAVVGFCAAAPHALHLSFLVKGGGMQEQIGSSLRTTRVLLTTCDLASALACY
jgi:hypothetical protein